MIDKYIPEDLICTNCNTPLVETDKGSHNDIMWYVYECPNCHHIFSDEPDWDLIPGGVDDC